MCESVWEWVWSCIYIFSQFVNKFVSMKLSWVGFGNCLTHPRYNVVWSSHCFVGLSRVRLSGVHIVLWGCLEWRGLNLSFFSVHSEVVWSSHCLLGLSIVMWSGVPTLFRGVVYSDVVGVHIISWVCLEWGGLEFTLFKGIIKCSHCSVGRVEFILFSDFLDYILFGGLIWSSCGTVGLFSVHIVQWDGLEFKLPCGFFLELTLLSGVVWSSVFQWSGLKFTFFSGVVWNLYCCVKDRAGIWTEDKWWSVEDSWSCWV